ncbi:replication protein [Bacillus pumilus]|uniref:phage replisome organizer N-terminal domain-containing protein n=1 Tax=Bacillus pumilus TaxID=1408 RepID=UPI00017A6445|nr:phage replisome organizer N-terminal domain-containing protein [Bacillus pumilus]EDW20690.1 gp45 [Bacillus pumilus ATCC 7061]MCR4353406.1 phage replisome organizer N-terminal domain-containing protein [Bacillus pumilus]MCY7505158.1 phage replisome organizer N-terminal domain-containing protein [Bacillus pumilus]MDR4269477.1 replication protein [Bacillus pumilus]MED4725698.1 phage replisome organizer N-terminal domain-containing protein [Bacillus pumilus]
MGEVKWVKLSTQMFDDEKIKLIEQMPESDTLLIIWVKLLAQAGKTNASGFIYLSENVPYTDEMLAHIFGRPLGIVRMALDTFRKFGMIEINEQNYISICNWEKHQNLDALEKIREQNRLRKQKQRKKQSLPQPKNDMSRDVTINVTPSHATDIDKELDKDKELKDILSGNPTDNPKTQESEIPFKLIVDLLNKVTGKSFRHSSAATQRLIKARWNDGFRFEDFKTVILTKTNQWLKDDKMNKYLQPTTLFGTKFEGYLNEGAGVIKRAEHQISGSGTLKRKNDLPF